MAHVEVVSDVVMMIVMVHAVVSDVVMMIVMVHAVVSDVVATMNLGTGMKAAGVVGLLALDHLHGKGMTEAHLVMTEVPQLVANLPDLMKAVAGDLQHQQGVMTAPLLAMTDHQCAVEMTVTHHQEILDHPETVVVLLVQGELAAQMICHQEMNDLKMSRLRMAG